MTLNEVMKDTADAIREKTGKSEKIAPINFAEEIKSISASGGESGGSTVEYLDLSGMNELERGMLSIYCAMLARGILDDGMGNVGLNVCSPAAFVNGKTLLEWTRSIQAIQVDFSQDIIVVGEKKSISDFFAELSSQLNINIDLSALPRITEAEFYDLNA